MTWRGVGYFIVLACALTHTAVRAEPRIKHVTLTAQTVLSLDIDADGGGTRFSFPFVLDEQDENVPYTMSVTNPAFAHDRQPGRNSFVVTLPRPKSGAPIVLPMRGMMFITVAGCEITVEMNATHDPSRTYSDIIFDLSEKAREGLIQKAVAQRTAVLEKQYKDKEAGLDELVDARVLARLGTLAMSEPVSHSVKERGKIKANHGDVRVEVEKTVTYGAYTILVFRAENEQDDTPVTLQAAKLFSTGDKQPQPLPIDGGADLPPSIKPGGSARGSLTVMTNKLPDSPNSLQLEVASDRGNVTIKW
jgi:hypothetical protein